MSDTGESITLATYARKLAITRQALINDDLGAFSDVFQAFGARAAAIVNALPYAILAANANLNDSVALFSTATTRGNLASSGAAISGDTLAAGSAAMFAQTAPGGTKLSIMPRFLLTGGAYMTQAQIVTGSMALPTAEMSAGVKNPFNTLVPIADANISGNAWYLAADPMMAATVEVAFLDGQRTPTLTQEDTSPILGVDFTAFIDATAKALDFRGLYKNAGALA
jgi:phage major head subunit gpT-like protein